MRTWSLPWKSSQWKGAHDIRVAFYSGFGFQARKSYIDKKLTLKNLNHPSSA